MNRIILASQSPRRAEILASLGIEHSIKVADIDETPLADEIPEALVKRLAEGKAMEVAKSTQDGLVIGSDTIVVYDGKILGKPKDDADAFNMLRSLSGRHHQVMTGVSVVDAATGKVVTELGVTTVLMKPISDDTIQAYIATGEPMDKAGAYGIQGIGSAIVQTIEGEFYTVMGLSVNALLSALDAHDIKLFRDLIDK